jgi:hypothetical protein
MIGEVIVHAAGLENMLVVAASVAIWHARAGEEAEAESIRREVQDKLLGESVSTALKICRRHWQVFARGGITETYLADLWDDCFGLSERRNAVAHSYWEKMPDGRIEAKRALPRNKRADGVEFMTVGGTLDEMADLRDQIADAIRDVKRVLDAAWPDSWPVVAAFTLRPASMGAASRPRKSGV